MRLNVYIITHPIIKQLSNQLKHCLYYNKTNQISKNSHLISYLYILLIYEVVRTWLKTSNIYIRNIDYIKPLCIFNSKESYLILTDIMSCNHAIVNIGNILPKVHIQHIDLCITSNIMINDHYLEDSILEIIQKQKIIIINNILTYSIIQLLDYLIITKNIKITQIRIMCLLCNNNVLEKIGYKYPTLSIYTTKIQGI